jgi:ribulose bisphosphate carboxylase small subunit
MTDTISAPVAPLHERQFTRLTQITVVSDDQISAVNQLLAEGWRLVSIGYRNDATVYVLGWREDKPKPRAGFLAQE